jgi:arylsulfatase A-like enzyme
VATPARPNVLLVVVDTLRADALGAYGCDRGLSPEIDALAAQGAVFENAFAHAPWTLPSFASILSSQPPQTHGAGGRVNDYRGLAPSIPTLPERFRAAGYATAAVVNVDFLARPFGVTRGFEHLDVRAYESNEELRDAARTTDAAAAWIAGHGDGAFFLMVHYFDVHAEYRPPREFRERFAAEPDRKDDAFRFGTRTQVALRRAGRFELRPEEVERAHRLYDAEVAYVDREIGRLLGKLSSLSLDERTLVVFTSDHGEEFLDHGDWEHGHTLYDELLRVPFCLRQPGRIAPRRIPSPVGHMDLAPTVLSLCGLAPAPSFLGRDVSPALDGASLEPVDLLAYGNFWGDPRASLRRDDLALITQQDGRAELYRWTTDPTEQHDLAARESPVADELRAALEREQAEAFRLGRGPGPRVSLSPEQTRRLSAVGYASDESGAKD